VKWVVAQTYKASKLTFYNITRNQRLGRARVLETLLRVTMCGGSNVVNVFKQKVNTKNDLFATVTPHNNLFVTDSLTIFTAQIAHLHMY